MTESMQEIFAKPLSTKNLCEKLEYWLDHEMTQELFNLSCEYEIGRNLLSQLRMYRSNCKKVEELEYKYIEECNKGLTKYKNHEMVELMDGDYYVSTSLYYKILEFVEWHDTKLKNITLHSIYHLKDINEFTCPVYKGKRAQYNLLSSYCDFLAGR